MEIVKLIPEQEKMFIDMNSLKELDKSIYNNELKSIAEDAGSQLELKFEPKFGIHKQYT